MTIDPTYEEWQEAHTRANAASGTTRSIVEAALGPCPPRTAPIGWHLNFLEVEHCPEKQRGVWVGFTDGMHRKLNPDEADEMAAALMEQADYAREMEASASSARSSTPLRSLFGSWSGR
jgi:hypothetical protein